MRRATSDEVLAHAAAIRRLASEFRLARLRLREDCTVVVHGGEPGHRSVTRLSAAASSVVGAYVPVITDDSPARPLSVICEQDTRRADLRARGEQGRPFVTAFRNCCARPSSQELLSGV